MKHKTFLLSLFILTLAIFAQNIQAQMLTPGMSDPAFGIDGLVLTDNQESDYLWYDDMTLQPDGKIIVLSTGYYYSDHFYYHFILTRYNADGTLDNEFGEGGVKYFPIDTEGNQSARAISAQLLPDGKIIIAATIAYDFGILRVNPNGDLDYSFGINGMVKTDFAGVEETSKDWIKDLIVRPDGKLLAYGQSEFDSAINPSCTPQNPCQLAPPRRIVMAQYNSDGSLDTSFGAGGLQKTRFSDYQDYPSKLFMQPDGKILVSGGFTFLNASGCCGPVSYSAFVRYDADGTVDRGFGKNGFLESANFSDFYAPMPDGKFLGVSFCDGCVGWYPINTRIVRYNSDLTPDTSFNQVRHQLLTNNIASVKLQADGKIIFTTYLNGSFTPPFNPKSIIYRFNPNGTADTSFGTNGAIKFDMDNSDALSSVAYKTLIQPDGNILVGSGFAASSGSLIRKGIAIRRFIAKNTKGGFIRDVRSK